jgi:acyl-CoA thioester hydrolase
MSGKQLVHIARVQIRWGDMDAMGHVNNAVYFRYIEQARIEWFFSMDVATTPATDGPVVINANCTFLRQLKFPGDLEIRTFIGTIGRSSFETMQEIRRVDDPDTLIAEGGAKVVWVDPQTGKSMSLPDAFRQQLTKIK